VHIYVILSSSFLALPFLSQLRALSLDDMCEISAQCVNEREFDAFLEKVPAETVVHIIERSTRPCAHEGKIERSNRIARGCFRLDKLWN
jgi:hypothetical protein